MHRRGFGGVALRARLRGALQGLHSKYKYEIYPTTIGPPLPNAQG